MSKFLRTSRLSYIFAAYFIAILCFFIFRVLNVLVFCFSTENLDVHLDWQMFKAFVVGWRFDTVISAYILALPLIFVAVGDVASIKNKIYYRVIHIFVCLCFSVSFFLCAADIPYFNYFFTRLNAMALTWIDSLDFVVNMIVQEPSYFIYLFLFLIFTAAYDWIMSKVYRKTLLSERTVASLTPTVIVSIVLVFLCFLGMRGRLALKSPIRVGTAYFSNNPFLNQIGLNPVFTFIKSVEEKNKEKNKKVSLIDLNTAMRIVAEELSIPVEEAKSSVHLAEGTNVVLIIMESMSADKVGYFNEESNLTPCLDGIIRQSLSYDNAYTAGIHTYNGVYSTLFSHPAILSQHSMNKVLIPTMDGLPNVLKDKGYQTLYFTTHDEQFDNIAGFLYANGIERIISQKDYPVSQVKSTLGVPDHVMYEKAIKILNSLSSDKPFFVCLMSSSDHGPYVLPEDIDFRPHSNGIKNQIVEYADWAIGRFMEDAKKTDWYNNTVFVFVADHGYAKPGSKYEMPLSYHHTPMLFFSPSQIKPESVGSFALQIDLGPTLLSMLFEDYQNNTLGIDLQREKRPYAYFSADDKIGVLSENYFYVYHTNGMENLYRLTDDNANNCMEEQKHLADEMRDYAFSMIQYSQYMLEQKQKRKSSNTGSIE